MKWRYVKQCECGCGIHWWESECCHREMAAKSASPLVAIWQIGWRLYYESWAKG